MERQYLLSLLAVSAVALTACATPSQMYWDRKVKELCEKEGGVTVYERIELTPDEFKLLGGDKYGAIKVPSDKLVSSKNSPYVHKQITTVLHDKDPLVRRFEFVTYRKSDNKILGKMVTYARSGGDALVVDAGSSFSCADMKEIPLDVEREIFTVKGQ